MPVFPGGELVHLSGILDFAAATKWTHFDYLALRVGGLVFLGSIEL